MVKRHFDHTKKVRSSLFSWYLPVTRFLIRGNASFGGERVHFLCTFGGPKWQCQRPFRFLEDLFGVNSSSILQASPLLPVEAPKAWARAPSTYWLTRALLSRRLSVLHRFSGFASTTVLCLRSLFIPDDYHVSRKLID